MRVIKVVHGDTAEDVELEKMSFALQSFDEEAFLNKHLADIISQSETGWTEKAIMLSINLAMGALGSGSTNLQTTFVVRKAVSAVLGDIRSQLDNLEVISLEKARDKYPGTHNLSIGTYTLHPYDGCRLTGLEYYHKTLAFEKDDELIILLGKMGAKTLRIVESDIQRKSGAGELVVDTVAVDVEGSASVSQSIESGRELLVTFEGNVVDIDPSLLKTSLWFANDSRLNAIFESRRFDPNKIERYTLRNTYTETFDFDFDLADRYLVVKVDLKAEYDSISTKERLFHVEFGKQQ